MLYTGIFLPFYALRQLLKSHYDNFKILDFVVSEKNLHELKL